MSGTDYTYGVLIIGHNRLLRQRDDNIETVCVALETIVKNPWEPDDWKLKQAENDSDYRRGSYSSASCTGD